MNVDIDILSVDEGPLALLCAGEKQGELWTSYRSVRICGQANGLRILSVESVLWPDCDYEQLNMHDMQTIHLSLRDQDAYLVLDSPQLDQWLEIAQAQFCRFVCCRSAEDFQRWDDVLSKGVPIYALCGSSVSVDLGFSAGVDRNPRPAAVLQAMAFGCFVCTHALDLLSWEEGRSSCSWEFTQEVQCSIIGHSGFQLAERSGYRIEWQDGGSEGYVRMHAQLAGESTGESADESVSAAWMQPRMIGLR